MGVTLPRKRPKPRRTTSPRCSNQRCKKRAEIRGLCVSHAEQRADRLFSRWVRDRDGRCTAAGVLDGECKGTLQAAHIVGRRNHAVRYDPRNVHALCAAHHYTVDQHGQEHAKHRWAENAVFDMERPGDHLLDDLYRDAGDFTTNRRQAIEEALGWLSG